MPAMLNRVSGSFRLPGSARRPKRQRATMPTDFDAAVKKRALYGSKSLDRFERILLSIPNSEIDEVNAELPWPDKYLQPQGREEFTKHAMDMQWRIIKILAREYYGRLPSSNTVHFGRCYRYERNDLIDQTDRLPNGVNNHPIGGPVAMLVDPDEHRHVREFFRPRFEAKQAIKAAQLEKAEAEKVARKEEEERHKAAIEEAKEVHQAQSLNEEDDILPVEEAPDAHQAQSDPLIQGQDLIEAGWCIQGCGTVGEEDEILPVEEIPKVEEEFALTTDLTPEEQAWLWENRHTALRIMRSKDSDLNSAVGGVGGASLPVIAETEEELEIPVVYKDQEDVPVGELAGGRKAGRKASAYPEGLRRGIFERFSPLFRKRTV